jgi:hypothetical protein
MKRDSTDSVANWASVANWEHFFSKFLPDF